MWKKDQLNKWTGLKWRNVGCTRVESKKTTLIVSGIIKKWYKQLKVKVECVKIQWWDLERKVYENI